MKLFNCFLLIGLLLLAQHTSSTILTNDFFSQGSQSRPLALPQGFPQFFQNSGGSHFFSNLQPQFGQSQQSTQQQFTPINSQQIPSQTQPTQQGQFLTLLTTPSTQQNQQANNQPQQNHQQFQQQNQQQLNQQTEQFVNQNQQTNFQNQNQNQGHLTHNQGSSTHNQHGSTNNHNSQQNLLNPIGHEHKRGSSHIDCEEEWKNQILIFDDNRRELCKQPRHWNGSKCVCPSNGVFLSGKCYGQEPRERTRDIFSLRFINRNFDGSENNPRYPQYGARGSALLRISDPNYDDGKSEILKGIPSPRDVSNAFGDIGNRFRTMGRFNQFFITWSQFIGNDITFTPTQANEPLNIPVGRCDQVFDKFCTGKQQLRFSRSIYQTKRRVRTHINAVSSWLDASNIYGSDQVTADSLREFKGGRMKLGQDDFLPKNSDGQFISGDRRVNQNVLLTILHTIFVRQHNRICQNITQINSSLTDEETYQIARNYIIGLIQHITFDQWLPLMFGTAVFNKFIGNYVFDPEANPAIFSEFQVGGLRVFDSFISPTILRLNPHSTARVGQINYKDVVENTKLLNTTSLPQLISGATRGMVKAKSINLVDDLRNFFITPEFPNQNTDLYSLNIQRGRDHGVGSLKDIRDALGLHPLSIQLAFKGQNNLDCLRALYQNPDNVDLWLALIGEQPERNTALGQVGNRIWIFQMNRIRNGDSLWYERVYPQNVVRQIKGTSLRTLLERYGGNRSLPPNPFQMVGGKSH